MLRQSTKRRRFHYERCATRTRRTQFAEELDELKTQRYPSKAAKLADVSVGCRDLSARCKLENGFEVTARKYIGPASYRDLRSLRLQPIARAVDGGCRALRKPGYLKHLAAAVRGIDPGGTRTPGTAEEAIGTAGTTLFCWRKGPSAKALVSGPVKRAMEERKDRPS